MNSCTFLSLGARCDHVTRQVSREAKTKLWFFSLSATFSFSFLTSYQFPSVFPLLIFLLNIYKRPVGKRVRIYFNKPCENFRFFFLCGDCFRCQIIVNFILKLQDHQRKLLFLFHRYLLLAAPAGEIHPTLDTSHL